MDALTKEIKRSQIEDLEQEQEKLLPAIKEKLRLRRAEEKRLGTGRRRAQRLLTLAEREGFEWVPPKGTAHRKGITGILALALRPQEDESVWDTPEIGGDLEEFHYMAIVMPDPRSSYQEDRYEKYERKIKRLRRELEKLEDE